VTDTLKNMLVNSYAALMFQDPATYQYQISFPAAGSSPLYNAGTAAGNVGAFSLTPQFVYVHPQNYATRCINATPDIGAYEECIPAAVENVTEDPFVLYPNPASGSLHLSEVCLKLRMYDLSGKCVLESAQCKDVYFELPSGLYYAVIINSAGRPFVRKILVQ
jgi:hypothetical protein